MIDHDGTTEEEVTEWLGQLLEHIGGMDNDEREESGLPLLETGADLPSAYIPTFADAGVLTNNHGLILTLSDGTEFQITIVQSRGAR